MGGWGDTPRGSASHKRGQMSRWKKLNYFKIFLDKKIFLCYNIPGRVFFRKRLSLRTSLWHSRTSKKLQFSTVAYRRRKVGASCVLREIAFLKKFGLVVWYQNHHSKNGGWGKLDYSHFPCHLSQSYAVWEILRN